MTTPRLVASGITKSYGPTAALRGVDLELLPGEVHALVGENGAGKSTLMKVLSGAVWPDAGTLTLDGKPYRPSDPLDARRHGVVMVYQELNLAPDLSASANILLGLESSRWGFLRPDADRKRALAALAELGHPEIAPDAPVSSLSPAARQLVEIARALVLDVRVLVLDEPTSALTGDDVRRLFTLVRRLRDRGVTVVYISHYLEEVEAVADRFTVLRDGRSVAVGRVGEVSRDRIVEHMVGRRLDEQYPHIPHTLGEPVLSLESLAAASLPAPASLVLRRGEVFGIAGLLGAGRTELLRAVFGLDPVRSGRVTVKAYSGTPTPRGRIRQGLGMLSEDRKEEGLALTQSIADNLTYSRLGPYSRLGLLNLAGRTRAVREWLTRLSVRCSGPAQAVGELSGGNQQKVALGRLLHQEADVFLLDEPTRGVDVGSKAEIYRLIGEQAARGKAVLVVSSYLPELFGVCDTIAVMARGRLGPARPTAEWTAESVMAAATAG